MAKIREYILPLELPAHPDVVDVRIKADRIPEVVVVMTGCKDIKSVP
jgi:hypothetical protein